MQQIITVNGKAFSVASLMSAANLREDRKKLYHLVAKGASLSEAKEALFPPNRSA